MENDNLHRRLAPRPDHRAFGLRLPDDGHIFETYVKKCLAPTLSPGDIVVMDNLSAHKVKGIRQAIGDIKARLLYLPPYSLDLNPIEMFFSEPKALLKNSGGTIYR